MGHRIGTWECVEGNLKLERGRKLNTHLGKRPLLLPAKGPRLRSSRRLHCADKRGGAMCE